MESNYDQKSRPVLCYNLSCREVLFVSSGPANLRGVDRYPIEGKDDKGPFVVCPKCGARHDVVEHRTDGQGVKWRIIGLRTRSARQDGCFEKLRS